LVSGENNVVVLQCSYFRKLPVEGLLKSRSWKAVDSSERKCGGRIQARCKM